MRFPHFHFLMIFKILIFFLVFELLFFYQFSLSISYVHFSFIHLSRAVPSFAKEARDMYKSRKTTELRSSSRSSPSPFLIERKRGINGRGRGGDKGGRKDSRDQPSPRAHTRTLTRTCTLSPRSAARYDNLGHRNGGNSASGKETGLGLCLEGGSETCNLVSFLHFLSLLALRPSLPAPPYPDGRDGRPSPASNWLFYGSNRVVVRPPVGVTPTL